MFSNDGDSAQTERPVARERPDQRFRNRLSHERRGSPGKADGFWPGLH